MAQRSGEESLVMGLEGMALLQPRPVLFRPNRNWLISASILRDKNSGGAWPVQPFLLGTQPIMQSSL